MMPSISIRFRSSLPGRRRRPLHHLPMVITTDPSRGIRNVGMYRVQVLGPKSLRCTGSVTRWALPTGARWRRRARECRWSSRWAAIPASIYSGSAPLPDHRRVSLRRVSAAPPVELARAVTCDLEVPAEAELVLEGYIDPRSRWYWKAPSGTIPGSIRWRTITPGARDGADRSADPIYPRPWWAGPDGGLLPGHATSGSSCRCSS